MTHWTEAASKTPDALHHAADRLLDLVTHDPLWNTPPAAGDDPCELLAVAAEQRGLRHVVRAINRFALGGDDADPRAAIDAVRELQTALKGEIADRLRPEGDGANGETDTPESPPEQPPEARVLAVLCLHPEWTDTRIAKEAGVNRTSLYRMELFKKARELQRADGRSRTPKGYKDAERNLDAWEGDE